MFKKLINLFKKSKSKHKIVSKSDDFIMFTSEEGMTEEESLQFIYDNLLKKAGNNEV